MRGVKSNVDVGYYAQLNISVDRAHGMTFVGGRNERELGSIRPAILK